jgi:hypothetical protein
MENYEQQGLDFLNKAKATMSIELLGQYKGFPNDEKDLFMRYYYQVKITTPLGSYSFNWYDSHHNWNLNKQNPIAYDILSSCEKYEVSNDLEDFVEEYGFEINSISDFKRVSKIHKACLKEFKALSRIFTEKQMKELQAIQ